MWEQYLTCEPCPVDVLPSCPQVGTQARGWRLPVTAGNSLQAQQHARLWRLGVPQALPGPSPLVGSIGHQPTCLEWRGQRMSQLSPAQGMRGRAAGDGTKRKWDLGMLPNPTPCKDILQILLPVSRALQLGTTALGL